MMPCRSCQKKFDEKKHYGICPKCGTYNRKKTPEESMEGLWDQNEILSVNPTVETNVIPQMQPSTHANKGFLLMVVLIMLLVLGVAVPIGIGGNLFMKKEEVIKTFPRFETDTVELGEVVSLHGMNVTVNAAYVVEPLIQIPDIPENSKLVAISMDLIKDTINPDEFNQHRYSLDPYVSYKDVFKFCIAPYVFEEYVIAYQNVTMVYPYDVEYDGKVSGAYVVFVDKDVTEINVSFEKRDNDNQNITIYEMVLPIMQEEINEE